MSGRAIVDAAASMSSGALLLSRGSFNPFFVRASAVDSAAIIYASAKDDNASIEAGAEVPTGTAVTLGESATIVQQQPSKVKLVKGGARVRVTELAHSIWSSIRSVLNGA